MRSILLLLCLTVAGSVPAGPPQPAADPRTTGPRLRGDAADLQSGPPSEDGLQMVVARPGRAAMVAGKLREGGVRVLRHLPGGALLVDGRPAAIRTLPEVLDVSGWGAGRALTPELRSMELETAVRFRRGVPVVVGLVSADVARSAVEELHGLGFKISWRVETSGVIELGIMARPESLEPLREALGRMDGLVWADVQPPVRLRNDASAWRCQSGQVGHRPIFEGGLDGTGQVVGVMDTGLDVDSCSFTDPHRGLPALNDDSGTQVDDAHRKVAAVDFYWSADWPEPADGSWDDHGHGTHVAGSVAGDGGELGLHDGADGMAPGARLVIQDGGFTVDDCADLPGLGCPVRPLGPMLEQAWRQGVRIHTNSWGDEENLVPHNRYTERTADVDRFVWEHPEMVVLFAAGNAGPADDTVGSPATGKNVVAVGATLHGDAEPPCVAGFSSRGFTHDGRIKPDVVAPGTTVRSAASDRSIDTGNCDTTSLSGTSMACPTVAGLAALVRQYFVDGFYPLGEAGSGPGFQPSAALVRAVLVASAVDLTTLGCDQVEPAPSRDQGWGLVQLDRALHLAGGDRRLLVLDRRDAFASEADRPVRLSVLVERPGPLEVVLAWTDPPSSSAAAVNLVNDLDLRLAGPDGIFPGNALVGGVSVAGGEPDRRNNVEVVRLPDASAGRWTVQVDAHAVAVPGQGLAVVVVGPLSRQTVRAAGGRLAP